MLNELFRPLGIGDRCDVTGQTFYELNAWRGYADSGAARQNLATFKNIYSIGRTFIDSVAVDVF